LDKSCVRYVPFLRVSVGLELVHFVGQGRWWPTVVDVGHGIASSVICSFEDFFRELFETFFVSIAYASKDDVVLMCANGVAHGQPQVGRQRIEPVAGRQPQVANRSTEPVAMGNRELANRGTQPVGNGQLGVHADQPYMSANRTYSDIQTTEVASTPRSRRS